MTGPSGPAWSLDGRIALVTGSSAGIGRATALELAAWGATVVVNSRSEERALAVVEEIEAAGGSAAAIAADLSEPGEPGALVDRAVERYGRVDILVNNAGHSIIAPSTELAEDAWRSAVELMLTAPFLCAQRAGAHMIERGGGGVIVNVGSILGHVGLAKRAAYVTAKHALVGLTKVLAVEWAAYGIRVASVDPAYVATEFIERSMRTARFNASALERRTPLGRLGDPEDVARAIAYLASDAAGYLTGSSLILDGGWISDAGWEFPAG